ncbi:MAG: TlpA family protein disulfide reductase [Caldilineales bacterium]|nr:TlpA family protein disulfide reductase [Caldilineales bacterium]
MRLLAPPGSILDEPFVLKSYLEDRLIAEEATLAGFDLPEAAVQVEEDRVLAVAGLNPADLEAILAETGLDLSAWQEELRLSVVAASYLEDVILADIPLADKNQRREDWLTNIRAQRPIRTLVKAETVQGLRPGNTPPDFTLPLLDGGTMRLSDLRGQPVLLNFWATWCLPCREEMPLFEQAYQEANEDGFMLLAVDVGEDAQSVQAFIDELGLTFPIALDRDQAVTQQYRIVGLPTSYYIDRDGVIKDLLIGAVSGMPELRRRIEKIGVAVDG